MGTSRSVSIFDRTRPSSAYDHNPVPHPSPLPGNILVNLLNPALPKSVLAFGGNESERLPRYTNRRRLVRGRQSATIGICDDANVSSTGMSSDSAP